MAELYRISTELLRDKTLEQRIYQSCSPMRREKADRCRTELQRRQSLAASCLLDYALKVIGLNEQEIQYLEGPDGKPEIAGLDSVRFSLSHSGTWAICAVSEQAIGADIEMAREFSPRLLQRYFDAEEQKDPLRVWVLKESFCKMTGVGIREIPTLHIVMRDRVQMLQNGRMAEAVFWEKQLSDGTRLAVCCRGTTPIRIQESIINRSDLI